MMKKWIKKHVYNFSSWYVSFYENPWVRFLVMPVAFSIPYLAIGMYANGKFQESLNAASPSKSAPQELIDKYLWVIYGILVILTYIWSKLYEFCTYVVSSRGNFSTKRLFQMGALWTPLIRSKIARFSEFATRKSTPNLGKDQIFEEITRPDQQLIVLSRVLCEYFNKQYGLEFKVRIISIQDGIAQQWLSYAPTQPETKVEQLNVNDSSVSICVRRKRMLIIEDITEELRKAQRRYVSTHEDINDDSGSMILIPHICEIKREVRSVIIIWCEKANFFTAGERTRIQYFADQIIDRVNLESCLLHIKGAN